MWTQIITLILSGIWMSGCVDGRGTIVVLVDKESVYREVMTSRDWASILSDTYDTAHVNITLLEYEQTDTHAVIQTLCEGTIGSRTLGVVDTTYSCEMADTAAHLFQIYIRVSSKECHGRHFLSLRPPLSFYADAAFSYTDIKKTLIAKTIFIYDEIFGTIFKETYQNNLYDFQNDVSQTDDNIITIFFTKTIIPNLIGMNGDHAISEVLLDAEPNILTRKLRSQDEEFTEWLSKLYKRKTLHFAFVIGTITNINILFKAACRVKIPDTFHWTVILTDDLFFNWTVCPIKHLVILRHRLSWQPMMQHVPISVNTAFLMDALTIGLAALNNSATPDNTSVTCSEDGLRMLSKLPNVTLDGITGNLSTKNAEAELELLKVDYPDPRPKKLGLWNSKSGLFLYNTTSLPQNKFKITAVTRHEPPFVIREATENGTKYTGYAIDVFDEIARRLNLDYTLYEPRDGQYGKQREDGTWSGLMGEILTGYADIAVASISMTTERDRVADFTTPYYEFGGIQIMIKSVNSGTNLLAFTTIFTREVWACWAAVLILSGVFIFMFERLSPYSPYNHPSQKELKKYTIKESMWLVIASFTMSGPECTPLTFSTRVMIGGFWFFCSIMMATYTANLAAFLTTSRLNVPIESLDDLAKQNIIKYSVVEGTVIHEYFERMASIESDLYTQWKNMSFSGKGIDPTATLPPNYAVWDYPLADKYMTIWKSIQKTGLVNSTKEGVDKVLEGNFAFIHESPLVQYELKQQCNLAAVGKPFSSRPYAFALPQDSPLTSQISYTILELQSETFLESVKTRWWKRDAVSCSMVDESSGLTFHTVGGIFLLVIAGIVLGVIALLMEIFTSSISGVPSVQHNMNMASPNSRTNLASDFGSSNLASGSATHDTEDYDAVTLELATMY